MIEDSNVKKAINFFHFLVRGISFTINVCYLMYGAISNTTSHYVLKGSKAPP